MKDLVITKELKQDIEANQNQLKCAIRSHQILVQKLKISLQNVGIQKEIAKIEESIIAIGVAQKKLLERLRQEYKQHQSAIKNDIVKSRIDEQRCSFNNTINRVRKQNIVSRPASVTFSSASDDSGEAIGLSDPTSPDHNPQAAAISGSNNHQSLHVSTNRTTPSPTAATNSATNCTKPLLPFDLSQTDFLSYFSLVTHDVYREMQNKRAERKRRSTANPQFVYSRPNWDYQASKKSRKHRYLYAAVSPPNTRLAVRKRIQELHAQSTSNKETNSDYRKAVLPPAPIKTPITFPELPNLPSGLTIHRVDTESSSSSDGKPCSMCKQTGGTLITCSICYNAFHVSCHKQRSSSTLRHCPACMEEDKRDVGVLRVSSSMSVSYVSSAEPVNNAQILGNSITNVEQKQKLELINRNLSAELTQLQDRHSQLIISLRNQKNQQNELLSTQHSTEDKINQILSFIERYKMTPGHVAVNERTPTANDNNTKSNIFNSSTISRPNSNSSASIALSNCAHSPGFNEQGVIISNEKVQSPTNEQLMTIGKSTMANNTTDCQDSKYFGHRLIPHSSDHSVDIVTINKGHSMANTTAALPSANKVIVASDMMDVILIPRISDNNNNNTRVIRMDVQ